MQMIDILNKHSFAIAPAPYLLLLGQTGPVEELLPGAIMALSVVPFVVLLAILKYHAAYHRKVLKWQNFDSGIRSGSSFSVYLREILLWEAKAAPVYSPILNGSWDLLCGLVVWFLFPPRFFLAYMIITHTYGFPQIFATRHNWYRFTGTDNFVYNCRRYRFVRGGLYHSKLEDGHRNVVYYPTADLHAIVPSDNR
jgi:hypothetical protein